MPFIIKPRKPQSSARTPQTNLASTAESPTTGSPAVEQPPRTSTGSPDQAAIITARQLAEHLAKGHHLQLIDVREPHERARARFPQAKAVPLGQLYRRANEFDPRVATVFICGAGKRSLKAIELLAEAGFTGPMFSLHQGIEGWARDIDNTLLPALAA
jgi:rhodanese-related sulfurtransferase